MSIEKNNEQMELEIQIDDETAQGKYVNLAMINHTETEFVIDLVFVQPQQPTARVISRIISSPRHTKRLISALAENIRKYEDSFGKIDGNLLDLEDLLVH